jgi:hypothetical protein
MILDRQLPHGGWNYGNTLVFDQELYPMPDTTGLALNALAWEVREDQVTRSLEYLKARIKHWRTPLSLGWSLLGLGAWGARPEDAESWIIESLKKQDYLTTYDTPSMSLLITAFLSTGGLERIIT